MANTNYIVLSAEDDFNRKLTEAGSKLVVADFTSARCPPCLRMAPVFAELAIKYPNAVFLKVDIKTFSEVARTYGVTATPTFIFFRNSIKLDTISGANPEDLEAKVRQHYGDGEGGGEADSGVPGHMDLLPMINKSNCECLNESDDHTLMKALNSSGEYLESDTDEQLIMNIEFTQAVKIHSLKIKAPQDQGPKTIKIFINQPHSLDFDGAESGQPAQEIMLTPKDLEGNLVTLKYVKFQNVSNLTVFVKDNQTDAETTKITRFQLIGSPVATTNMSDFKRISGKKGESH